MEVDSINNVRNGGFQGFLTVSALRKSGCHEVPEEQGVYLVLRPKSAPPVFTAHSTGGHFKGKDPTVPISSLENAWVERALVLYIGKAGGPGKQPTLRSRLCRYMQFGQGSAVAHWGGRFIWQLEGAAGLIVCWKPTPNCDPRAVEKTLIQEFKGRYGRRPFANLKD
jgi:hypothetical protein